MNAESCTVTLRESPSVAVVWVPSDSEVATHQQGFGADTDSQCDNVSSQHNSYGHLMLDAREEAASRLDQTVFGNSVRRLLENQAFEDRKRTSTQQEIPEAVWLQGLKFGSGEGI